MNPRRPKSHVADSTDRRSPQHRVPVLERVARLLETSGRTDAALRELIAAFDDRQRVDGAAAELWRWVTPPKVALTPTSRVERVVREAETALALGGEAAPVLPTSHLPEDAAIEPEIDTVAEPF
jgi:hypothetical protein